VKELLEIANVLVIPAFGYIIVLERRITTLQTQVKFLIEELRRKHGNET
jgi:hypothetical protein